MYNIYKPDSCALGVGANNLPIIATSGWIGAGRLNFIQANDPAGASWGTPLEVDAFTENVQMLSLNNGIGLLYHRHLSPDDVVNDLMFISPQSQNYRLNWIAVGP